MFIFLGRVKASPVEVWFDGMQGDFKIDDLQIYDLRMVGYFKYEFTKWKLHIADRGVEKMGKKMHLAGSLLAFALPVRYI
jgi:hypothetical protein